LNIIHTWPEVLHAQLVEGRHPSHARHANRWRICWSSIGCHSSRTFEAFAIFAIFSFEALQGWPLDSNRLDSVAHELAGIELPSGTQPSSILRDVIPQVSQMVMMMVVMTRDDT
jgi:hypothetical protein